MNLQKRKELVEVALGKREADTVLKNDNLINVFSGEMYRANIYIFMTNISLILRSLKQTLSI